VKCASRASIDLNEQLSDGLTGLLFAIFVEKICCVAIFAIISLVNLLNVNWFN